MLNYFRVKREPEKVVPDLGTISVSLLESDANLPFTIRPLNNLPEAVKRRVYRGLISPTLSVLPHQNFILLQKEKT
jgi:hypothetical protein